MQYVELDGWWASSEPPENGEAHTVLVPTSSRTYLLPNGDRRSIEVRGEPLDERGRLSAVVPSWDSAPSISDTITALDPEQGVDFPQTLPTKPSRLAEVLAPTEACPDTRGGCLLSSVSGLFETYVVSPRTTAEIWEALATEPTITSLGKTTDRLGRKAIAITALSMSPHEQLLVLIDPDSGRYLGSEAILVAPDENWGLDPPAVISFTSLVTSERIPMSEVPDPSTAERF